MDAETEVVVNYRVVRDALRRLVERLPKCDFCTAPATKAYRRGSARYCDEHADENCPDYPRAEPLRHAMAVLKVDTDP